MIARLWRRWVSFIATREDPTSLACTRILVSLTISAHVFFLWTSGAATFLFSTTEKARGLAKTIGGVPEDYAGVVCIVCAVVGLCAALGFFTRTSLLLLYVLFRWIEGSCGSAGGAYDSLLVSALFLLLVSGGGRGVSVDAFLFGVRASAPRWARVLIVGQLSLMYAVSATYKLSVGWVPGGPADALWYVLHQPNWARFGDLPWWMFPLTQVATTSVWIWELLCGLLLVLVLVHEKNQRTPAHLRGQFSSFVEKFHLRTLWVFFGLLMHVGIELTMQVGPFNAAALSLVPCCFLPVEIRSFVGSAFSILKKFVLKKFISSRPPSPSSSPAAETVEDLEPPLSNRSSDRSL